MCNFSRESKGTKHNYTARAFRSRFSFVFNRTLGLNEKPWRTTTKSVGSEGKPMDNRSVVASTTSNKLFNLRKGVCIDLR